MDQDLIRMNYKKFSTEKLIQLNSEIDKLTKESILILQEEFYSRNEKVEVLKITEYLLSKKYIISENSMFNYINQLKKDKLNEFEIINDIYIKFGYDKSYYELLKINIKSKGKEDIFNGFILIVGGFIFMCVYIYQFGSYIEPYVSFIKIILTLITIGLGIQKIEKGATKLKY